MRSCLGSLLIASVVGLSMTPVGLHAQRVDDEIDVLFLGNSYIYFNNLPGMVAAFAEALGGPELRVDSHTHGGFSLQRHLDDGHLPTLLQGNPAGDEWELVVLQEQSSLGTPLSDQATGQLGSPTAFHNATRELSASVRSHGAEPVLYMTWAKRRHPDQIADLAAAYQKIGDDLQAEVAPVGLAWERVRNERPDLELFVEDGSHPNATGTYLAACVIYSELTGLSPLGAPAVVVGAEWNPSGMDATGSSVELVRLDSDIAEYLQSVAWDMVMSR